MKVSRTNSFILPRSTSVAHITFSRLGQKGSVWLLGMASSALLISSANAQNVWTGTTSGVLNVSGNYAAGVQLSNDGNDSATFVFGRNVTNNRALTATSEFKVNRIQFEGADSFSLTNSGQFSFVKAASGITQSSSANQTISGSYKMNDAGMTLTGNGSGIVTLSGTWTGGNLGLTKSGTSWFNINGDASSVGTMTISGGVLQVSRTTAGASLGTTTVNGGALLQTGTGTIGQIQLRGGVYMQSGTFSRALGTTAAQVNFGAGGGGFAAFGGTLNVQTNLGTWGATGSSLTTGTSLILGSSIADNVVTLSSALNLGTAARTIQLVDNTNSAGDSAAISGIISGALGGLNLTGAGNLTLSGVNTYTGVTTIGSGVTLSVGSIGNGGVAGNLGQAPVAASNLVLSGGTLRYTGTTAPTNRNFTLTAATTSTMHVFTADTVLTMSGASTNTTGALTKAGPGTLVLSAANLHTGGTVLTTGTLRATTNAGALGNGALTLSGGILDLVNDTGLTFGRNTTVTTNTQINSRRTNAGAGVTHSLGTLALGAQTLTTGTDGTVTSGTAGVTFGATTLSASGATFTASASTLLTLGAVTGTNTSFTVNGEGDTTLSGIVGTGTGGLTKAGGGILTLSANNTQTGITTINGGTLSVATINDGGLVGNLGQAASAASNLVLAGGTLRYTGATASTNRNFTLGTATTSAIHVSNAATVLTMTGASAATNGALTKAGAGTLVLTGANGHTGGTTISAGTLQVGNAGTIGSLSASGAISNNSALSFNRTDTLTQGTHFGTISGTGNLAQAGSGTLVLGSANTYSGATTVSGGRLVVNGSTSSSSAVGVSSGAILGGSGNVGGNTTIASGGTLAPGNSPGVLTIAGTTTLSSGSIFEWELDTAQSNPQTNRGVAYDGLNTSALAGSGAIFKVVLTGTQDFADTFWNQNRTWTDIFKSADGNTALGDLTSVFSGGFQYSYNGQDLAPISQGRFTTNGSSLTWSVIPEPSNAMISLLCAAALLRRRRA